MLTLNYGVYLVDVSLKLNNYRHQSLSLRSEKKTEGLNSSVSF